MIPVSHCDLCYSTHFQPLFHINRTQPEFDVVQCPSCGLIFQNPRFSDEEIHQFYDEGYYKGNNDFSYIDERENFKGSGYVWNKRVSILNKHLKVKDSAQKTFLDIGCSFGGFLKCAENAGFIPYGIDVSEYAARYARDVLQLNNVLCGEFTKGMYPENFFDVITLVEVIEHIKNPHDTLKELFRVLKPGGVLLLQTANMDGVQSKKAGKEYHYFLPGHLFYFSKKTLTRYLNDCGFTGIKIFHGVDFGLLPKLKKSAGTFKKWTDYKKWFSISFYHLKSKIHKGDFALTSSMVIYARK